VRQQFREFLIRRIGHVQRTPKGNLYLECDTDLGVAAVWGRQAHSENISQVQSLRVPVKVRAGSIVGGWSQHTWWIPEEAAILPLIQQSAEDTKQNSHRTTASGAAGSSRAQEERSHSEATAPNSEPRDPYAVLGSRRAQHPRRFVQHTWRA
jgi:hypothetical protein